MRDAYDRRPKLVTNDLPLFTNAQKEIARLGGVGILTGDDIPELNAGMRRVLDLLSDHQWHTRDEIELAAGKNGIPAAEGMRRMRDLRAHGYRIKPERIGPDRTFHYKLLRPGEE